jgi:hypothetical protein
MHEQVTQEREKWRKLLLHQIEKEFSLDKDSFCVVGSFPLDVLGVKKMGDIDLSVLPVDREKGGRHMFNKNIMGFKVESMGENRGFVSFLQKIGLTEEELILNDRYYFRYHGYKVIRPELNYAEKLYRCTKLAHVRPKDFLSIELMERHLKTGAHPGYTWDDNLVLFPKNFKDKLRMSVYHPLFKILFHIRVIEKNWSYISKFFWCLEYKGLKNTIKMTHDWYGKRNRT